MKAEKAEQEIRLDRTGRSALTFCGVVVASVDGRWTAGKEQNRYHNLTLYQTASGRYVVHIEYVTNWEGELNHSHAAVVDLAGVEEALLEYDPCAHVQGFPNRPVYAERQANLLAWVRQRYEVQVSELLGQIKDLDEKV